MVTGNPYFFHHLLAVSDAIAFISNVNMSIILPSCVPLTVRQMHVLISPING